MSVTDEQIATARVLYETAAKAFIALAETRSKAAARKAAFRAWHEAATRLFNLHNQAIATDSRDKVDRDATWYTYWAETAVNLLEVIRNHYATAFDHADGLGLDRQHLQPSLTAFANIQRLAVDTHPKLAQPLRDGFLLLGLPTHGFDTAASEKPSSLKLDWQFYIAGCCVLAVVVGFGVAAFAIRDLSADQRWVLKLFFPMASGFAAWTFAGDISVRGKHPLIKMTSAATGGFAVWLLTHFLLPEP